MTEDDFPIQHPKSSKKTKKNQKDKGVLLEKHEFNPPRENLVVPRGSRIRRQLEESANQVEFKFYNSQSEYATPVHSMSGSVVDVPMPSNTPLGRNAAVWRYRRPNMSKSDWYNSGYYWVAKGPALTYPAGDSAVIRVNKDFSGTGDVGFNSTVQLRRASDNTNLSDWVTVQDNGTWVMPLRLPFGTYGAYLAGSGQYWQVESRSPDIMLDVSWPPTVTSPANNSVVTSPGFVISGKALPNALVHLHIPGGEEVKQNIPADGNGFWNVTITNRTNRILPFVTQQTSNGITSSHSTATHTLYLLGKVIITRPQDGIIFGNTLTIRGTGGCPGAEIRIHENNDGSTVYGKAFVTPSGAWAVVLDKPLPRNPIYLTCRQVMQNVQSVWADSKLFAQLSPPSINQPGVVDVLSPINGTHSTGVSGIQVDIYRDLDTTKVGGGTTGPNGWTGTINNVLQPGAHKVQPLLNYYNNLSVRGPSITLHIRTAPPVIQTVEYRGAYIVFNGIGHPSATVQIHPGSGSPNATGVVGADGKFQTGPIMLLPGRTGAGWGARQFISDGAGGKIDSLYHRDAPSFKMPTPVPVANSPIPDAQRPSFGGTGHVWTGHADAQIEIRLDGATHSALPRISVASNGTWLLKASQAIAPGSYKVTVLQLMNGVYSLPIELKDSLIIKPLAPANVLAVPNGLSAEVSGSCWPGASLLLLLKPGDLEVAIPASSTAEGKWRSTVAPQPGGYNVTVTQTFSEQTSPHAGPVPFNIATPKPKITSPVNQQETDFRPEIKGNNGYPGATVAVFDSKVTGPALGETIVPESGDWIVELVNELALGEQDIYTLQTFKTQASERSVSVRFNVMVPVPTLTPSGKNYYARYSEFEGKGLVGAVVKLIINGAIYETPEDVVVDENGNWKVAVYQSEVGVKTLQISQTYAGGTRKTDETTFITGPNAPDVESPESGAWVDPRNAFFAGHGHPDDTVFIRRADTHENLGSTVVNEDQQWSMHIKTLEGDTQFPVYAYSGRGPIGGDHSATKVINLQDLAVPRFVYPFAGLVHISTMLFSGWGIPGATIWITDAFNPQNALAPNAIVDENGKWSTLSYKDFTKGPHWVVAQQSKDGKKSPWVRSGRFMVESPLSGFMRPYVLRPYPGAQVGRKPWLAGIGVVGAVVYIFFGGKELCQALVGANGCWAAPLPELALGPTTLRVVQARHGYWSEDATPPTFKVIQVIDQFDAPTVVSPAAGETVDTRFWIKGKGMPGAEVEVRNFNNGNILYGTVIVDPYGDFQLCMAQSVPLGNFTYTVRQTLDGQNSKFSSGVTVTVVDALPAPTLESHLNGEQIAPLTTMHGRGFPEAKIQVRDVTNGNFVLCEAVVNKKGYWEAVTQNLPLRFIRVTAWQVLSPKPNSPWMTEIGVTVVNAG
ncbi:hypothetical protein ACIP1X_00715 [Pseudomonas sp. NPDC088885]|uniref:hypothetical protein n=1 Tax=Pseudomonas sp. NPDC088885 TaxID=3364457 RepID=UPI003822FFA3